MGRIVLLPGVEGILKTKKKKIATVSTLFFIALRLTLSSTSLSHLEASVSFPRCSSLIFAAVTHTYPATHTHLSRSTYTHRTPPKMPLPPLTHTLSHIDNCIPKLHFTHLSCVYSSVAILRSLSVLCLFSGQGPKLLNHQLRSYLLQCLSSHPHDRSGISASVPTRPKSPR